MHFTYGQRRRAFCSRERHKTCNKRPSEKVWKNHAPDENLHVRDDGQKTNFNTLKQRELFTADVT